MSERSDKERAELLAKKVMGWREIKGPVTGGKYWMPKEGPPGINANYWHPERNTVQAIEVAEKLREMGWLVTIYMLPFGWSGTDPFTYEVIFTQRKDGYECMESTADTLPEAICLAAEKVAEAMGAKEHGV